MKMGRPTIEPATRKKTILTLRVSEAECEEIEAAATKQGSKPSSWARETLLQAARQTQDQAGQ